MSLVLEPTWNKPVKEFDRALDPLGMNRVNDRMIGELALGFTLLTPRARYYAFYVWVIDQIRKKKLAKSYPQFRSTFYDIERLFMLACVSHEEIEPDKNHNDINGANTGRRIWSEGLETISLNFTYFGHRLGGYGQYYEGSLVNLGLIEQGEEDEFERPTELGKKIIKPFERLANDSKILSYLGKRKIPRNAVQEIGKKICLCKLTEQEDSEKKSLQDLFFGYSGYNDKYSSWRQKSLALILSIIEQSQKNKVILDSQNFLNASYFNEIINDGKISKINIPNELIEISQKWKLVKAHDNLSLTTESILQCFLQILNENLSQGISLDEFFDLTLQESGKQISNILKIDEKENLLKNDLKNILKLIFQSDEVFFDISDIEKSSLEFDKNVLISSKISELTCIANLDELISKKELDIPKIVANGILLVLQTAIRFAWRVESQDDAIRWVMRLEKGDIGIAEFTNYVRQILESEKLSLEDFIRKFIQKYVIFQAEDVYKDKIRTSPNPKCWFHKEGNNYVKDRDYKARHRSIRFPSAISLLNDLELVNSSENLLDCSDKGHQMLSRVINSQK